MSTDAICIRSAREDDEPFIFSSWLKSNRSSPLATYMTDGTYYPEQSATIRRLLDTSVTLVAAWKENRDQAYGFVCGDRVDGKLVVHYVYVKRPFRRTYRIGRRLLDTLGYDGKEPIIATHVTYLYTSKRLPSHYDVVNNPYLAHRKKEQ